LPSSVCVRDLVTPLFNRLAFFNGTELKKYDEALGYADALFHKSDSAKFSYYDYTYYGNALSGAKQFDKAIEMYNKALQQDGQVIGICAQVENELAALQDDAERAEFMQMYGLKQSGLDRLVVAGYGLLGLISYLTAGEPEVRAWTIKKGDTALIAAGKIHTDFMRGFIKAEVVSYDDFVKYGDLLTARENGRVRQEGRDYIVQDGDIIHFKFNV
jgi:Predicted GTPase, probable translation factor